MVESQDCLTDVRMVGRRQEFVDLVKSFPDERTD